VNRQCDTAKVRRLLISYFSPSPMVLSVLIATISAPGLLGSQEAIRQSQSKDKREEHRARRCNLIAACVKSSKSSREIDGRLSSSSMGGCGLIPGRKMAVPWDIRMLGTISLTRTPSTKGSSRPSQTKRRL